MSNSPKSRILSLNIAFYLFMLVPTTYFTTMGQIVVFLYSGKKALKKGNFTTNLNEKMIQIYKRMQKMREKYVDTLAKLYDYATTVYSKKQYTQADIHSHRSRANATDSQRSSHSTESA